MPSATNLLPNKVEPKPQQLAELPEEALDFSGAKPGKERAQDAGNHLKKVRQQKMNKFTEISQSRAPH